MRMYAFRWAFTSSHILLGGTTAIIDSLDMINGVFSVGLTA